MNYSCADNASVSASIALLAEYEALQALPLYQMATSLWTFYPPVIVVLGIFGNVMSIVIMRRKTSGDSTVNIFFVSIAVGDLIVLITGFLKRWLEHIAEIQLMDFSPAAHYVFLWSQLVSAMVVNWLLVSVTVQRVISVVWPHRVSHLCTKKRVCFLIGIIPVVWSGMYAVCVYFIYLLHVVNKAASPCSYFSPQVAYINFVNFVLSVVGLILYSILPFVILALGNCILAFKLAVAARTPLTNVGASDSQVVQRQKAANSVTITVFVVSMAFVVLTIPICTSFVLLGFENDTAMSIQARAERFLFTTVSQMLSFTNSAVNFYLYCLTGRRFRQEFVNIVCHRKSRSVNLPQS